MPPFGPVKRKDLIKYLRHSGFEGPYSGGKHQFMVKGDITIQISSPRQADI
jgi:predicted RNA binding protein YcfA (HicA-like mRNA interferase family)